MLNKLSKLGLVLPHLYFACIAIIIAFNLNYFMIIVAVALLAMIFMKKKTLNVTIAAFLLFFSFWMLLAYISDFQKITKFNTEAWRFTIVGSLFIITNFFMSILMGLPFFKKQIDISENEDFITGFQIQNSKL